MNDGISRFIDKLYKYGKREHSGSEEEGKKNGIGRVLMNNFDGFKCEIGASAASTV